VEKKPLNMKNINKNVENTIEKREKTNKKPIEKNFSTKQTCKFHFHKINNHYTAIHFG